MRCSHYSCRVAIIAEIVKPQRRYRSPRREESAAETRRRIREAARELFVANGYGATSVPEVARKAGVATKTVYLAFPTKLELLNEVIGVALVGDFGPAPVRERDWFLVTVAAPPEELIDLFAQHTAELMSRAALVLQVAEAAADVDPAVRRRREQARSSRRADIRVIAAGLSRQAPQVDVLEAADLMYALAAPLNFIQLELSFSPARSGHLHVS